MADAAHVGLTVDEVEFPVELGKVREFLRAVGAVGPGGEGGPEVPLTFVAVAGHWRDQAAMVSALELDLPRLVVGEAEWEYRAPLRVGDTIRGARVVTAVDRREGTRGTMTRITLETRWTRADGEVAVIQRETVIELPR